MLRVCAVQIVYVHEGVVLILEDTGIGESTRGCAGIGLDWVGCWGGGREGVTICSGGVGWQWWVVYCTRVACGDRQGRDLGLSSNAIFRRKIHLEVKKKVILRK